MHHRVVTPLFALVLFTGASCNQSSDPGRPATLSEQASRATASATPAANPAAPQAGSPIPPKDAQWTLYCTNINGVAHVEQANQIKSQLLKTTALRDWYVIHQEQESILYYGFYRSVNDPKDAKETARAHRDRTAVAALVDQMGNRLFGRAMFVGVDAPDPTAPPEWNLANAQGYWSWQIAVYKDSPQRKQFAVEAVRDARAQGIEAYYYHGSNSSSVCIGAYPREALKEQRSSVVGNNNSSQPLIVSEQPLSGGSGEVRLRETGELARTLVPVVDPQDPKLIQAMQQYPEHSVNGEVMYKVGRDRQGVQHRIADPSFLVVIPKAAPSRLNSGSAVMHNETPIPPPVISANPPPKIAPPPPAPRQTGKLRSIED